MALDRDEIRGWLERNCPAEMRAPPRGDEDICWGGRRWVFHSVAQKLWFERCLARGLTVPSWPTEYGGAGYSREDAAILAEEMQRITRVRNLTIRTKDSKLGQVEVQMAMNLYYAD